MVLRDDAYGMIRWKQSADGFRRSSACALAIRISLRYAKVTARRVIGSRTSGALYETMLECCRAGGVHLIDVPIDYSENQRVLIDELEHRNGAAPTVDDEEDGS